MHTCMTLARTPEMTNHGGKYPATSDDDFLALAAQADERLEKIIAETEAQE